MATTFGAGGTTTAATTVPGVKKKQFNVPRSKKNTRTAAKAPKAKPKTATKPMAGGSGKPATRANARGQGGGGQNIRTPAGRAAAVNTFKAGAGKPGGLGAAMQGFSRGGVGGGGGASVKGAPFKTPSLPPLPAAFMPKTTPLLKGGKI